MNSFMLSAASTYNDANDLVKLTDTSIGGRLLFGLQVTLLGMSIVFSVLILLWFVIAVFGKIINATTNKTKVDATESVENTAISESVVSDESEVTEADNEDEELVAILTAAVAAFNESVAVSDNLVANEEISGFRIVSFKERKKIV